MYSMTSQILHNLLHLIISPYVAMEKSFCSIAGELWLLGCPEHLECAIPTMVSNVCLLFLCLSFWCH